MIFDAAVVVESPFTANALLFAVRITGVAAPEAVSGRFAVSVSFVPGRFTCRVEYVATPFVVDAATGLLPPFVRVPAVALSATGMLTLVAVNGVPFSLSATPAEKFVSAGTVAGGLVLKLSE